MLKAIIFDFDGVILESVDIKGWAFQKLFEAYPSESARILDFHYKNGGLPRANKIKHILKEFIGLPYDDPIVDTYCERFSNLVFQRVVESPFVPGALEALQALSSLINMFIVSGTPHEEINRIIDIKGLRIYFQAVYGSPNSKEAWTKKILIDNRLLSDEVIWVGDALSDWVAARKHGVRFAARLSKENLKVFQDLNVNFKMNDLTKLSVLVENLRKENRV